MSTIASPSQATPERSIAAVIPCHSADRLDRIWMAVGSVLDQSRPPDQVIVVVDHNPALEASLCAELPSGVKVIANALAAGAAGARNEGASASGCDYTFFVDDDVRLEPDCLEQLVAALEMHQPAGTLGLRDGPEDLGRVGVGGWKLPDWETGPPSWLPTTFYWTLGVNYQRPSSVPMSARGIWADCMLVPTQLFLAAGGFRLGFGKVGARSRPEDTELCLRLSASLGMTWVMQPTARCWHLVPVARCSPSFFLRRCYHEGRGKADIRRFLGDSTPTLGAEASFLCGTLPRAVISELRTAVTERDSSVLGRLAAMIGGTLVAVGGYLTGYAVDHAPRRLRRRPVTNSG